MGEHKAEKDSERKSSYQHTDCGCEAEEQPVRGRPQAQCTLGVCLPPCSSQEKIEKAKERK